MTENTVMVYFGIGAIFGIYSALYGEMPEGSEDSPGAAIAARLSLLAVIPAIWPAIVLWAIFRSGSKA